MTRIVADRGHRAEVEALHVHDRAKAAGVQHVDDGAGDAAEGVAALDLFGQHDVFEELGRGQRSAARAGLERKTVPEQPGGADHVDGGARHDKADGIAGDARGAGDDALRIADAVHGDDAVDPLFLNHGVLERIRDEVVGDDDRTLGAARVGFSIAERAAGAFADFSRGVAHGVGRGRGDERHVDRRDAVFDGARASAVRAENDRFLHAACGDEAPHFGPHVVGFDAADDAAFNVVDNGTLHVEHGAAVDRQIAVAHGGQLAQNHVHHAVAVAQVVMERNPHAVFQPGTEDGVFQRGDDFAVFHSSRPPLAMASAMAIVCSARATIGLSIILP